MEKLLIKLMLITIAVLVCGNITGCATVISGNTPQTILIETVPSGAAVQVLKFSDAEKITSGITPFNITVEKASGWGKHLYDFDYYISGEGRFTGRKRISYELHATMPGYISEVVPIQFVQKLSYADSNNILLIGQSVGGFSSLVTASLNPPGVKGVVNFSGGHGGRPGTNPGYPCSPERMTEDIGKFAKTIRVPVLWHYAENDKYFAPQYVRTWFKAFQDAGARGRLVIQPPFDKDGHSLFFSNGGIPIWTPEFDKFWSETTTSSPANATGSLTTNISP